MITTYFVKYCASSRWGHRSTGQFFEGQRRGEDAPGRRAREEISFPGALGCGERRALALHKGQEALPPRGRLSFRGIAEDGDAVRIGVGNVDVTTRFI